MAYVSYAKATGQRFSDQIWSGLVSAVPGEYDGEFGYFDDFGNDSAGAWVDTQATSGTIVQSDYLTGSVLMDAGATTADQGIQRQSEGETILPAAGRIIRYEARVKPTNLSNQFFIGLAVEDTTVIAAGENSTANHIGWELGATDIASDGTQLYGYAEKAGTRNVARGIASGVLTSGSWVNVGFRVIGTSKIEWIVNNVIVDETTITSSNIPVTEMTPTLVCQSEGTTQPTLEVDYIRCFQDNIAV